MRVREKKDGEVRPCIMHLVQLNLSLTYMKTADADDNQKKEALLIASMGHGLDGHPGLAHGGTIATLFDEGLSLGALQVLTRAFVTAQSTIKYKAAVNTPSKSSCIDQTREHELMLCRDVILVRCWCEKFE